MYTAVLPRPRDGRTDLWVGIDDSIRSLKPWWKLTEGSTWFKGPDSVILGAEAAAKLAALGAPEIAYLSCDPSTLARDLAVLTGSAKKGQVDTPKTRYEIVEMHLFDLFPQTYHIETLVRLRRAP